MRSREPFVVLGLVIVALVASGIAPFDRTTWWLEVVPVLIAVPVLLLTGRRFPLTPLLYRLVSIHALVLILGAHYTYARVPIGEWARDAFHLARNPYDRFGHFLQGFTPAIAAREVLLRTSPLQRGGWLFFIVLSIALAISAAYELTEWAAAVVGGEAADEFLGTQGDVWDTQWDMFLALLGAVAAQGALARLHDRQLASVTGPGHRITDR